MYIPPRNNRTWFVQVKLLHGYQIQKVSLLQLIDTKNYEKPRSSQYILMWTCYINMNGMCNMLNMDTWHQSYVEFDNSYYKTTLVDDILFGMVIIQAKGVF